MTVVVDKIGNLDKFLNYLSIQYNDGKQLAHFWRKKDGTPNTTRHVYVFNSGVKVYIVPSSKPTSTVSWQQINMANFKELAPNDMIFYVSVQNSTWFGFHAFELQYATDGWAWDNSTHTERLFLSLNKTSGFKVRNGYGEKSLELYCKQTVFEKRIFNTEKPTFYCMESPEIAQ